MGQTLTGMSEAHDEIAKKEEELEKANAHYELLEWIDCIKKIEDEPGKSKLEEYTQKLKALTGDSEDQSGLKLKTALPWDEMTSAAHTKEMKKHIYSISKETDLLSREVDELEFNFDFDMEEHMYQAIVLRKLDKNLLEIHQRLVPDLIGETSFWRNYFYEIELYKKELGVHSRIGARVDGDEQNKRQNQVNKMYAGELICEPATQESSPEVSVEVGGVDMTTEMVELVKQEETADPIIEGEETRDNQIE